MHGMQRAREAQALAEQRRDDAERLIQFMLGDFADKLRPINRLDLLDSVGQQALAYLSAQSGANDAPSALSRARALRTLGEVRVTRQQFEPAREPLQQAAALLAPWGETAGEHAADVHFEAGTIAYWRGAIAYRQSNLDQAEVHWLEYLAAAQRLKAVAPDDPRTNVELAAALNNLGTLAEGRDQFPSALEYFQQAATIRRQAVSNPQDRANLDFANTLSWISRIHNNLGQPAQAWDALEQALSLVSGMRQAGDDNLLRQRETNLRYLLGMNSIYRGDLVRARQELGLALALARQDVLNDPSQPRRQAMLAKIIFEWVRVSAADSPEVHVVLGEGLRILSDMAPDAISGAERLALEANACLAQLPFGPTVAAISDCRERIWPALMTAKADRTMLELAAELAAMIERALPGSVSVAALSEIERELTSLPAHMRVSLGHMLILHALRTQIDPTSTQTAEVTAQIDHLRASFTAKPEGD